MTRPRDFGDPQGQPDITKKSELVTSPDRKPGFSLRPLFDRELKSRDQGGAMLLMADHFFDLTIQLCNYMDYLGFVNLERGPFSQVYDASNDWAKSQITNDKRYVPDLFGRDDQAEELLAEAKSKYDTRIEQARSELPANLNLNIGGGERIGMIERVFEHYVFASYATAKLRELSKMRGGVDMGVEEFGIPQVPFYEGIPIYDYMTATMHEDNKPIF